MFTCKKSTANEKYGTECLPASVDRPHQGMECLCGLQLGVGRTETADATLAAPFLSRSVEREKNPGLCP